jgi:ferrous iron transport protein B
MCILYIGDDTEDADKQKALLTGRLPDFYDKRMAIIFMVFTLLYMPCFAATVAIFKEAGWKWGLFVMGYTTALAWGVCYVLNALLRWIL